MVASTGEAANWRMNVLITVEIYVLTVLAGTFDVIDSGDPTAPRERSVDPSGVAAED